MHRPAAGVSTKAPRKRCTKAPKIEKYMFFFNKLTSDKPVSASRSCPAAHRAFAAVDPTWDPRPSRQNELRGRTTHVQLSEQASPVSHPNQAPFSPCVACSDRRFKTIRGVSATAHKKIQRDTRPVGDADPQQRLVTWAGLRLSIAVKVINFYGDEALRVFPGGILTHRRPLERRGAINAYMASLQPGNEAITDGTASAATRLDGLFTRRRVLPVVGLWTKVHGLIKQSDVRTLRCGTRLCSPRPRQLDGATPRRNCDLKPIAPPSANPTDAMSSSARGDRNLMPYRRN